MTATAVRCDVCGQPTDAAHYPCDPNCHRKRDPLFFCGCDNTTCGDCCWHEPCREAAS